MSLTAVDDWSSTRASEPVEVAGVKRRLATRDTWRSALDDLDGD